MVTAARLEILPSSSDSSVERAVSLLDKRCFKSNPGFTDDLVVSLPSDSFAEDGFVPVLSGWLTAATVVSFLKGFRFRIDNPGDAGWLGAIDTFDGLSLADSIRL